jgi:hypothetical protein
LARQKEVPVAEEIVVVHGTSCQVENPAALARTEGLVRIGWGTILRGEASSTWVHFSIPSPLHPVTHFEAGIRRYDARLLRQAFLCFQMSVPMPSIRNVHLYDGPKRFYASPDLDLARDDEVFRTPFHPGATWEPDPPEEITNGLGIAVNVSFQTRIGGGADAGLGAVTFFSAGARFDDVPPTG